MAHFLFVASKEHGVVVHQALLALDRILTVVEVGQLGMLQLQAEALVNHVFLISQVVLTTASNVAMQTVSPHTSSVMVVLQ